MTRLKKIAFQGAPGANSHEACRDYFPGYEAAPYPTFEEAFEAVKGGECVLGMIPVENSIAGRVGDVHHLLPSSGLRIVGEKFKPIRFQLMANRGVKLEEVKVELELEGELPQEVTVPMMESGWRLGEKAKVEKAKGMALAQRRKKLRVVKQPFGKIGSLLANAGPSPRVVTGEQVELVAEYKALSARMNRMDSPRSMMIGVIRTLGGKEGTFLNGLERGLGWSREMLGLVREAMPIMRAHVDVVEATLARVRAAWAVFEQGRMMRRLWMVDLMRASGLSDQAVKDFKRGKLPTLKTLKALEVGLNALNAAERSDGGVMGTRRHEGTKKKEGVGV
jgi:hypothetical protein